MDGTKLVAIPISIGTMENSCVPFCSIEERNLNTFISNIYCCTLSDALDITPIMVKASLHVTLIKLVGNKKPYRPLSRNSIV